MVIAWKMPKFGILREVTPFLKSAHISLIKTVETNTVNVMEIVYGYDLQKLPVGSQQWRSQDLGDARA